jgi:hypothetical protein
MTTTTTPTWAEHLVAPRPSLTRELGERVAYALIEENLGTRAERAAAIAGRATRALAIATGREHQRQDTFARLNPDFAVLPDAYDPAQHRFAQQRERALALGERVAAAERSGRARGEASDVVFFSRLQAPATATTRTALDRADQATRGSGPVATYPCVYHSDNAGLTTKLAIAWDGRRWVETEVGLGRPLPYGHIWAPHPDHPDAARILDDARQTADRALRPAPARRGAER